MAKGGMINGCWINKFPAALGNATERWVVTRPDTVEFGQHLTCVAAERAARALPTG